VFEEFSLSLNHHLKSPARMIESLKRKSQLQIAIPKLLRTASRLLARIARESNSSKAANEESARPYDLAMLLISANNLDRMSEFAARS